MTKFHHFRLVFFILFSFLDKKRTKYFLLTIQKRRFPSLHCNNNNNKNLHFRDILYIYPYKRSGQIFYRLKSSYDDVISSDDDFCW